jgi:uncharacterized C2H2 Zn-finger protein
MPRGRPKKKSGLTTENIAGSTPAVPEKKSETGKETTAPLPKIEHKGPIPTLDKNLPHKYFSVRDAKDPEIIVWFYLQNDFLYNAQGEFLKRVKIERPNMPEPKYPCPVCGMKFYTPNEFSSHVKKMHS